MILSSSIRTKLCPYAIANCHCLPPAIRRVCGARPAIPLGGRKRTRSVHGYASAASRKGRAEENPGWGRLSGRAGGICTAGRAEKVAREIVLGARLRPELRRCTQTPD